MKCRDLIIYCVFVWGIFACTPQSKFHEPIQFANKINKLIKLGDYSSFRKNIVKVDSLYTIVNQSNLSKIKKSSLLCNFLTNYKEINNFGKKDFILISNTIKQSNYKTYMEYNMREIYNLLVADVKIYFTKNRYLELNDCIFYKNKWYMTRSVKIKEYIK